MASVNNTSNTSTTSSYSYLQYKNKIGGLVSGMDVDSIMEKLMKAESAQMEKLQQQKQKYEWKRDSYREVNTALDSFQKGIFDNYGLKSSWNMKNVSNNSTAITATATSSASGSLNITEAKLATSGQKIATVGVNYESSATLGSAFGITSTGNTFNFTVNGVDKSFAYSKNDTISSLIDKLNNNGFSAKLSENGLEIKALQDVTVSTANYSRTFATKLGLLASGSTDGKIINGTSSTIDTGKVPTTATNSGITSSSVLSTLGVTDGSFTIQAINNEGKYETKTISYKATDTVKDLMSKISSSGVGITAIASQSSTDGLKLSLTADSEGTGASGAINVSEDNQGIFRRLGLLTTGGNTGSLTSATNGGVEGTTGYIKVNGVKVEGTSNSYTVAGYQLKINENFTTEGTVGLPTGSTAKISSTTNTDDIVKKVKEFVDTYNGLITDLNTRVSEKRNVDYAPLTDAQKAEMNEEQIKKWEEKAKAGIIKGDSNINTVLSNMRSILSQYGDGTEDMLYKIGISTSKTWTDGGKLEIDEDELRKALSSDPDIVSRIFTGDSSAGSNGIVSELRSTAQTAIKNIEVSAGKSSSVENTYSLGRTIISLNDKIDDWKDRLKDIEERYWNQFSAMETAIQKANSQSSIFDSY